MACKQQSPSHERLAVGKPANMKRDETRLEKVFAVRVSGGQYAGIEGAAARELELPRFRGRCTSPR
jgi:hypothetical protein